MSIEAITGEELFMGTLLNDTSVVDDEDPTGPLHSGQAVSNN